MTNTPQLTHEQVAEIAQEHEAFLTQLEGLAIQAIASGDWSEVYDYINDFRSSQEPEEATLTEDPLKELWAIAFNKQNND